MELDKEKIKQFNIGQLRDYCLHVLSYIAKEAPAYYEDYKNIVLQAYAENNLRGMKILFKDINEWSKGLSKQTYLELQQSLSELFANVNKDDLQAD